MAAHKGPASLRPRCTWSGSSVDAIPVYTIIEWLSLRGPSNNWYSLGALHTSPVVQGRLFVKLESG
jgi:hypothetical protein